MANEKNRILLMIDESSIGGGQQHVLWLAQQIDKTKFQIAVACEPEGFLVDQLRECGILHYPIVISNRFSMSALRKCRNVIRSFVPSLVHTHGGTAGFYGRLASLFSGVPFIVHTYHGIHYLHWKRSFKRGLFYRLDRLLVLITDMIICVAQNDFILALQYGLIRQKKSIVIKNGINVKNYQTKVKVSGRYHESGKESRRKVVGTIGRLHEQKGYMYFLQAAGFVLKEFPETMFHIVGDGELRISLEQYAQGLGIAPHVKFLGTRNDIPQQLASIDIFVLSSLWEGLPIVLLEAMAARKPIVATAVNGVTEIVEQGKQALLVPSRDAEALAQAMMQLLRNESLSERLSEEAYLTVCNIFDVRKMVTETEGVYRQLLNHG